jgi:hypothetical protein
MKIKNLQIKLKKLIKNIKFPIFVFLFSFFGAYAGSHGTSLLWRRAFLPAITTAYAYITLSQQVGFVKALWCISIMSMWGALSLGYGIPDDTYPENPNADSGSDIGRFFTLLFRQWFDRQKAHRFADYLTRGAVGLAISTSLLSVSLLIGNWLIYTLGSLGIIISQALISWRGLGSKKIKLFGKEVELCISDIVNYAIIGFCVFAIITYNL